MAYDFKPSWFHWCFLAWILLGCPMNVHLGPPTWHIGVTLSIHTPRFLAASELLQLSKKKKKKGWWGRMLQSKLSTLFIFFIFRNVSDFHKLFFKENKNSELMLSIVKSGVVSICSEKETKTSRLIGHMHQEVMEVSFYKLILYNWQCLHLLKREPFAPNVLECFQGCC